jgi:arginase family enzyme
MLFAIDAWFDVTTARRGSVAQSIFFAAALEVPFAIALVWVGLRSLRTQQRARIVEEDPLSS